MKRFPQNRGRGKQYFLDPPTLEVSPIDWPMSSYRLTHVVRSFVRPSVCPDFFSITGHSRGREYWVKKRSYLQILVGTPSNRSIKCIQVRIEEISQIGRSKIHLLVAFLRFGTGISENSLKFRSKMASLCDFKWYLWAPQLSPMPLNGYSYIGSIDAGLCISTGLKVGNSQNLSNSYQKWCEISKNQLEGTLLLLMHPNGYEWM